MVISASEHKEDDWMKWWINGEMIECVINEASNEWENHEWME